MLTFGLQRYIITTLYDIRWELPSWLLKVACLIYRIKTIGHSNDKNFFVDTFRKRPYSASEYKINSQEFRKNPDWGGKIETFVEYSKICYSSKIRRGPQQIASMLSPIKTHKPAPYRSCAVSVESYRGHSGKKGHECVSDPQARCKEGAMGRLIATLAHAGLWGIYIITPNYIIIPGEMNIYACVHTYTHTHAAMHQQSRRTHHVPHTL